MAKAVKRQRSLVWLQGLACGAVVALAPGLALLGGVLLAPGLVALVLDREPARPLARCVLLMGLATCVPPLRLIWPQPQSVSTALALAGDMRVLGTAWSAAAAGWLLAELAPLGTRLVLEAMARSRIARLRAERAALVESWGEDGELP